MIVKDLENQIREYLTEKWGLDMNMYDGKVIVDDQQNYTINVFFQHKKTKSVIFLNDISYIISERNYRVGIIQLLDDMPKDQKPFFS